jgi:hypothetical protein
MKKILAIVLSIVMIFSMSAIAFAADDAAVDEQGCDTVNAAIEGVKGILDSIMNAINTQDLAKNIIASVQSLVNEILASLGISSQSSVLGVVANLEAKIGDLGIVGDILEYIENLINNLKAKIKALYAGNKETTVEETTAAEPAETGSTSVGIVAFAAVSVAAAAAYVCTKKKED